MSQEVNFDVAKSILKRHETRGLVGMQAIKSFQENAPRDASENRFDEGEEIHIPKDVDNFIVSDTFNGISVGSIACVNGAGKAKLLPLGSLTKNVIEYEQKSDGTFDIHHDKNGQAIMHNADDFSKNGENAVRQEVLSAGNMYDVAKALAGKTLKVARVMGPYNTARWKNTVSADGSSNRTIIGLRPTRINVYEEVKEAAPEATEPKA